MKNFRMCMCVSILALFCSNCVPVLVGGLIYKSTRTKADKQQFMQYFQQVNMEREKNGLPPLDLCTEKYGFDKGWAMEDPNCKKRILAYERGDTKALGTPALPDPTKKKEQ